MQSFKRPFVSALFNNDLFWTPYVHVHSRESTNGLADYPAVWLTHVGYNNADDLNCHLCQACVVDHVGM